MLVTRWQAPLLPSLDQLKQMFRLEGLTPEQETFPPNSEMTEHRHPFDEVRTVISGELHFNVSGNKLLLRPGDRIIIPSNTRHATKVGADKECISLVATRIY